MKVISCILLIVAAVSGYNPDSENRFHLFTRANPRESQPLVSGGDSLLADSNFNAEKRIIVLIHGWLDSATSDFNTVLVPAFLDSEDVNVIVVDWYGGGGFANYATAVENTPLSGHSVARFITWLNHASGATVAQYHLVGHGLGGHQAGIVGRQLRGQVPYITALDPAFLGWVSNDDKFKADDGLYTEVIHTNAGVQGYLAPLGKVDFYPNGGVDMPGCISLECDHARSFFYMAESVRSGGFTGTRCGTYIAAMTGNCLLWGNVKMGGLEPKTESMGIYWLRTRAFQPFSFN